MCKDPKLDISQFNEDVKSREPVEFHTFLTKLERELKSMFVTVDLFFVLKSGAVKGI